MILPCCCRKKLKNAISIEDLNAIKFGERFQGDLLVVYKETLDKVNRTCEVLHVDLKDEMIIILNVSGNLVPQHEHKIIPRLGISITNFQIAPRADYDREDCDCILVLIEKITIESIPCLCIDYYFIPNTTINQLLTNTNQYPIGTIGALVITKKKVSNQYALHIKDG
jgi:hypothetical protein